MTIEIRGAQVHNLAAVDVDIGDGLTVVTGVSGSGKTSLVFDTLYHEARRRLLDILSTSRPGGWRQQMAPARVESITGLGPAVAVEQNILNRNPLSTLATASGLHPFLRLLYANYGTRYCPRCSATLNVLSEDELIHQLLHLARETEIRVSAPLVHDVQGSHRTLLALLAAEFPPEAIQVDGRHYRSQPLDPEPGHDIALALGLLTAGSTLADARALVCQAASLGCHAITIRGKDIRRALATAPVCSACGTWFRQLEPKHFHQPCPYCDGEGCSRCDGTGSHPEAAAVRWSGLRLPELLARPVSAVLELFARPELPPTAARLLTEINRRLEALQRVGLGYIALHRPSPTLSRGESQRVRLALSLTSRLEDMLHVLDEPTIGQHPADVTRFLPALLDLPGRVVYVEHDRTAAAAADHVIDLGPGAGTDGGQVVFAGSPAGLWATDTPTGRYFSLRQRVLPPDGRPPPEEFLKIRGAHQHNLQDIDADIPLGRLTVITGVSGSGKSTLVEHVLAPSLLEEEPVGCRSVEGKRPKPVLVDQSPIGKNPRSNPATYTKLADVVRQLFSAVTGLSASHFSFNRPEGACPTCKGMGALEVKMQYLYSVWIRCSDCDGQRFSDEVLAARVPFGKDNLSIADFYELPVRQAAALFARENRLPAGRIQTARRILRALDDVGLGYLPLGQPSPSLSGGEAQRVKLTKYLGQRRPSSGLLILDEPSTGLHPQDLDGLLLVLHRLVSAGATIVVVEHNTDVIRAGDWIIDLGPGAGPEGGQVLYAGPTAGLLEVSGSPTARALLDEALVQPTSAPRPRRPSTSDAIRIRNARANNLKGIDVDIPKGKLTIVTGVSGSGKSSLVSHVLEAEARRRYLESLSIYERQGTREGPEAPVDSVTGLGVTLTARGLQAHIWSTLTHFTRRASVGRATELSHHLAILLAAIGRRTCLECGAEMQRGTEWTCPACRATAPIALPRHFSSASYASACTECTGVGILLEPCPDKLIVHPEKPLCGGAMYSPGYWPQSYLCQDTGWAQALGLRHGFDPARTPWIQMSDQARQAFLYGDPEPLERTYRSKSHGRLITTTQHWGGFYGGWVRDWDVHGTYTRQVPCPACHGTGLKPTFLAVQLAGHNIHQLSELPLSQLEETLSAITLSPGGAEALQSSLDTARRRLRFLRRVGLAYLSLNRPSGTLSAGEAQRIQLASLLGSGLTSLTILLDEPSRGMHPRELAALSEALAELRDEGNTVIAVEHDLQLIRAADHLVDIGPGPGILGGRVVASGTPEQVSHQDTVTSRWLRPTQPSVSGPRAGTTRRSPASWLTVSGARANNLRGEEIRIPLGVVTGICGVSGSGKSSLITDTLGRALVRRAHTTSFADQPTQPGEHDRIEGAPPRTILVDQSRRKIRSPAAFLSLRQPLLKLYAASPDAASLGLDEKQLGQRCSACKGRGLHRVEMGFLPDLHLECETCAGTGYSPEAWQVRLNGYALPEINALSLNEVYQLFRAEDRLARPLEIARQVGLGYLVWNQPAYDLSGGEAQRLKIAKELCRKTRQPTLYILDEPTVGQHMHDVERLNGVLHRLAAEGHSIILIEHHAHVLAACDWLIEMGPGGGPEGGRVIAAGTPEAVADAGTPTAPFLRQVLEAGP